MNCPRALAPLAASSSWMTTLHLQMQPLMIGQGNQRQRPLSVNQAYEKRFENFPLPAQVSQDCQIFLRELISNATDATLKLKHLTNIGEAKVAYGSPQIEIKIDKEIDRKINREIDR